MFNATANMNYVEQAKHFSSSSETDDNNLKVILGIILLYILFLSVKLRFIKVIFRDTGVGKPVKMSFKMPSRILSGYE
jgi:hypothetical protein